MDSSPDILRGASIATEAGGGFIEKERATIVVTGVEEEKAHASDGLPTLKSQQSMLTPTAKTGGESMMNQSRLSSVGNAAGSH